MFTKLYANSPQGFEFGGGSTTIIKEGTIEKLLRSYNEFDLIEAIPISKIEQNIDKMYERGLEIKHLWDSFIIADALVYCFAFLLTVLLILVAFLFKKNKIIFNIMLAVGLISFPAITGVLNFLIANSARHSEIENLQIRTFNYSSNIYISGVLTNKGKYDYKDCSIHIIVYKKTDKAPKDIVNRIKPLDVHNIKIENLKKGKSKEFFVTVRKVPKDTNFTTEITDECK